MLAVHGSPMKVFVLAPMVLLVLAIGLGVSAIARRRALARLNRIRTARAVVLPPRYASMDSFPMRRFIWTFMLIAAAGALLVPAMYHVRVSPQPDMVPATRNSWVDPPELSDVPDVRPPEVRAPEVRVQAPTRKPRAWFRPEKPVAPVETPHEWKGEVERSSVASLADSDDEKYAAIRDSIVRQLHLRVAPPVKFFKTPAYFKIDDTRTDGPKHDPDIGDYYRIVYNVELTPVGWHELSKLERAERAGERMDMAARGLGLLTVLLGAVAAFVRLDDWTKGYYSGRLFLAAFGLAGLLCVVIAYA